jgi:hypothetical protein
MRHAFAGYVVVYSKMPTYAHWSIGFLGGVHSGACLRNQSSLLIRIVHVHDRPRRRENPNSDAGFVRFELQHAIVKGDSRDPMQLADLPR